MEQDPRQIRGNLKDIQKKAEFRIQDEISEGMKRRFLENTPVRGQQVIHIAIFFSK